jgi:aminoglycoside phosphotransferase (APT) family kinase protein
LDWRRLGIGAVLEVPDHPAAWRLRGIVREIERHRLEPYPEFVEVIDWLERRMPPPRPPVLTHGDFRAVQVLLGEGGEFHALLDWEFARLSDPVDEAAYFTAPTQAPLHLIPGAWEQEDFVSYYERVSRRAVDRTELHWWQVLNMLWVMSFVLQAMRGIIEHRTDALRTAQFNTRLMDMLLSLVGI